MSALKKLRKFDNTKKELGERLEFVEKVLEDVEDLDKYIKKAVTNGDNSKVEQYLENYGTYLLRAKDVESERKIKNSFYQTERDYRKSADYKNTNQIDFDDRDDICYSATWNCESLSEEYIFRLFDPDNMDNKAKRNLLKIGVSCLDKIENPHLKEEIELFFAQQIEKSKNGKELLILNYAAKGLTDKEISEKLHIPRRTVSERLSNLMKN